MWQVGTFQKAQAACIIAELQLLEAKYVLGQAADLVTAPC